MHFLVVKRGALGDVVRTSYFAKALKDRHGAALRLSWITAPMSGDLLRLDPNIDDLWFDFEKAKTCSFDRVFSLDDEMDALEGVAALTTKAITGAFLKEGKPHYSDDAAEWFDMGLHSRFGKQRADELKKLNQRSHGQIYSDIFSVSSVHPSFHLDPACRNWAKATLPPARYRVGINPYSGGRWPSKELRPVEIERLLSRILDGDSPFGNNVSIVLVGAGADFHKNKALVDKFAHPHLSVANTDQSVQHLAGVISCLDYMISSDSLALHLAVAQDVPFTAFFAPTSAAEIDDWGIGTKILSTAPDYCSYKKDADNTSITADRIIQAIADNPRLASAKRKVV